MHGYLSVVVYLGFIIAFAVVSLGMAWVLSPKRPFASKLDTYECGAEPIGGAWVQFPVGFYLVALVAVHMVVLAVANLLRVGAEIAANATPGGFTGLPFVFTDLNQPGEVHRQQASLAVALLVATITFGAISP